MRRFMRSRQSALAILSLVALLLTTVSTSRAQNEILDLTWEGTDATTLVLQAYPTHPEITTIRYSLTEAATGAVRIETGLLDSSFEVTGLVPLSEYLVLAEGLDASGQVVATSPVERVDLEAATMPGETVEARIAALMNATLESLDPANCPFIYSTVDVSRTDAETPLPESAFRVFEDGRLQTDSFQVTPPSTSGGSRIADIIFLVDNSGSMGGEQNAVRQNITRFAQELESLGIDFRLGLVRFGQAANGGNPIVVNSGSLTGSASTFITQYLNQFTVDGGFEPGLAAVQTACNTFAFRPGSQRRFLLITDEDSDGGSLEGAASCALSNNITVDTAVSCGSGASNRDYCGAGSIRDRTGGLQFNVTGPYDAILDEIVVILGSQYIVRYRTDNPCANGGTRTVTIEITEEGVTMTVTGQYTPGTAPEILRTPATVALGTAQQIETLPITIAANVRDAAAPFVASVTLSYRVIGESDYTTVNMTNVSGDLYEAIIPGARVLPPGVQFFMTATDGVATVTAPPVDAPVEAFQFAVRPNFLPAITHTPPEYGLTDEDLALTAEISDDTEFVSQAVVRYREVGDLVFAAVPMANTSGNTWQVSIPSDELSALGLEYKIEATDNLNTTGTSQDFVVKIYDPDADLDGDGLRNGWELRGIPISGSDALYELPGADPEHKDLYVEVDAMTGRMPRTGVLQRVENAFADAPNELFDIANPDGRDGITLHAILDETDLTFQDWTNLDIWGWPEGFDDAKDDHFGTDAERSLGNWNQIRDAKERAYRYCIFANRYGTTTSSGLAERPGNDFMVTLGAFTPAGGSANDQAGTFMHELGHNLDLTHTGSQASLLGFILDRNRFNYKPNYLSVMNYTYQRLTLGNPLDFSRSALPTLDESGFDETAGFAGDTRWDVVVGPPPGRTVTRGISIDLDRDNNLEVLAWDLNHVDSSDDASPSDDLRGYNDWANVELAIGRFGSFADGVHEELPIEADEEFARQANGWGDCDNNGITDAEELLGQDCNGNGLLDSCDITQGNSQDLDNDGVPDECTPPPCDTFEVVMGESWDGTSLQEILDTTYGAGVIDVENDYEGAQCGDAGTPYWLDDAVDGWIIREIADFSSLNVLGWYVEELDGAPVIDGVDDGVIFDGSGGEGESAFVGLTGPTRFGLYMNPNGSGDGTNAPEPEIFFTNRFYNDIGPDGSGALHLPEGGDPQALIFNITELRNGVPTYVIAWEDIDSGSEIAPSYQAGFTDNDYNDMVVEIRANSPVSIDDDDGEVGDEPIATILELRVAPNPFNPTTVVSFTAPQDEYARVVVYDVRGREVEVLFDGAGGSVSRAITWTPGERASGVYFVRLETNSRVLTEKVTLLK